MDSQRENIESSNGALRKRKPQANANAHEPIGLDDLANMNEVGNSAKRQVKSSHKIFEKFLSLSGLPALIHQNLEMFSPLSISESMPCT